MRLLSISRQFVVLASVLILLFWGYRWFLDTSSDEPAATPDPLKQCDTLTSHPHDPGRFTAGVPDDQLAPGLAIPACEAAVRLNPELARAHFELGRAYWNARRDNLAFSSFVEAARRGYAPAMKYIGDAFLEGRGLPAGQKQDAYTAISWYKKSADGGFIDAQLRMKEAEDYIAKLEKDKFDPSIFLNAAYMTKLYNGDVSGADSGIYAYASGLVTELDGETMFFIDQGCKKLITVVPSIVAQLGAVVAFVASDGPGIVNSVKVLDQGQRDATILQHRYGCDGQIARKVMTSIAALPHIEKFTTDPLGALTTPPATTRATAAPAPPPANPRPDHSGEPVAFQDGTRDRANWENWVLGLSGDAHDGAEYWAAERSKKAGRTSANCADVGGRTSPSFRDACEYARQFLSQVDRRRSAEPDYRRGFNTYP